jgi:ssDNA-specific exonuclease RecJ
LFNDFTYESALKIFVELGLIERTDGIYKIGDVSKKMDLFSSKTYSHIVEVYELINYLYQNELSTITNYFKQILEENI